LRTGKTRTLKNEGCGTPGKRKTHLPKAKVGHPKKQNQKQIPRASALGMTTVEVPRRALLKYAYALISSYPD
jgi:hypothetical protein